MSNKKDYILLIIVAGAALWAALLYMKPQETPDSTQIENSAGPSEALPPLPGETHINTDSTPLSTSTLPQQVPTEALLGARLKEIGQCLEIQNSLNNTAKPTFAELQASLQSVFGDLEESTVDWSNTEITLPSGEKRRIRIENEDFAEEQSSNRILYYYTLDTNELAVPIPLPPEQTKNPSSTFIASLEKDGQITLLEEAHRGVYSDGAELYYVERNGLLSEVEMSYLGKSVRCQDLDKIQGACRCF